MEAIFLLDTSSSMHGERINQLNHAMYSILDELDQMDNYTKEQIDLLDDILKSEVEKAGPGTRAGVVAAATFLPLEFPYKIPYFYENGRLTNNGSNNHMFAKIIFIPKFIFGAIRRNISFTVGENCDLNG